MAREMDIEAPKLEDLKKNVFVPPAEEAEKESSELIEKLTTEVKSIGGNSGKKNKGAAMSDADAACYASRYTDLGKMTAREHFRLKGNQEGRLSTCARELTDYEAMTYLQAFPELQQKFGDGISAMKQARNHYTTVGYSQAHFSEKMKDTTKSAWKCGEGAKQSCKCHGTLWYGATKRNDDDKKAIKTWEDLRQWKTLEKQSEEWMSCTDAEFGGDPWENQEKQCWCEDKPAYKPYRCADEGEECICDGGWVVYAAKLDEDKKVFDFFGAIKQSMAVVGTRGKRSIQCTDAAFDGADPAPDAEKTCFCDSQKKFFDKSFVHATRTFWKASQIEKSSEGELKRTAEHVTEVQKVTKEKETSSKESMSAVDVEDEKALKEVSSAKTCAIQSIEEAYKFKKIKITQRRVTVVKTITKRRSLITQWNFQLNIKRQAADQSCSLAGKKNQQDKARLETECKRLTAEAEELQTQISIENEKINQDEKVTLETISKEENEVETKRTKDTLAVNEKGDEDSNEIQESKTEKELDFIEEKEQLLTQQ
jgi:hypothetical protein